EDGIRGFHVTGVQTCALPISAKAMMFLTQGYGQDATEILKGAMFAESYDDMVIIKDIELYSLCEHHMLPFFGKAHVAYIPNGHRSEERRVGKERRTRWRTSRS